VRKQTAPVAIEALRPRRIPSKTSSSNRPRSTPGLPHEGNLDQSVFVEAEPDEGTAGARILGEADALWQEQPGLDSPIVSSTRAANSVAVRRNCGPEVLNFDQPLPDEDYLGYFVDPAHP